MRLSCMMTMPSVAVALRKPARSSEEPLGSRNAKLSRAIGVSANASVRPGAFSISATGRTDLILWNAHRLNGAVRQFERLAPDSWWSVESGIFRLGAIVTAFTLSVQFAFAFLQGTGNFAKSPQNRPPKGRPVLSTAAAAIRSPDSRQSVP